MRNSERGSANVKLQKLIRLCRNREKKLGSKEIGVRLSVNV